MKQAEMFQGRPPDNGLSQGQNVVVTALIVTNSTVGSLSGRDCSNCDEFDSRLVVRTESAMYSESSLGLTARGGLIPDEALPPPPGFEPLISLW